MSQLGNAGPPAPLFPYSQMRDNVHGTYFINLKLLNDGKARDKRQT
jgi:hypothetical protein